MLGPAADNLIVRDTVEFAIRGSNLAGHLAASALIKRPLGAGLDKTAIGPAFAENEACNCIGNWSLDKTAIGPAFAENSLARPLIIDCAG